MNEILVLIQKQMELRHWTTYRLSVNSGIPVSTLVNIFKRNNYPTLPTLQMMCEALGLTLAQLLAGDEENPLNLPEDELELFFKWRALSDDQQALIVSLIDNLNQVTA